MATFNGIYVQPEVRLGSKIAFVFQGQYLSFGGVALTPPVVSFSPPNGTFISPNTPIQITVEDTDQFASIIVTARFPDGQWDVVAENGVFAAQYSQSTRVPTGSTLWQYTVKRNGGWHAAPTFRVVAVDSKGAVA
jgi:hypothetical protein